MLSEIRAIPGVTSAGGVTSLPTAVRSNGGYWIQGGPGPEVLGMKSPQAVFNVTTPDYFKTLQVPIVRGRDFNDGDRLDAPFVAMINEQLAKDAFPGRRSDRPHDPRRTRLPRADDHCRHRQGRAHAWPVTPRPG